MIKKILLVIIGALNSNVLIASDWKELPNGFTGFYTENTSAGSRVILSDITTGQGIMEVALYTVNPKCGEHGATGEAYMYINNTLVQMSFLCTENGMSMYFGKNERGKDYIFTEFTKNNDVCYSFKKELKGLCFSAAGFNYASKKLSSMIIERNNAL